MTSFSLGSINTAHFEVSIFFLSSLSGRISALKLSSSQYLGKYANITGIFLLASEDFEIRSNGACLKNYFHGEEKNQLKELQFLEIYIL